MPQVPYFAKRRLFRADPVQPGTGALQGAFPLRSLVIQGAILVVLAVASWWPAGSLWARDFPKDARRGAITAFRHPEITIGKVTYRMVPASRIRNEQNLIILPQAMPPRREIMYQLDFSGNIRELWILTEEEVKALGSAPKQ